MKFSDIIGNERAAARVREMIDADRLPHALLLHGRAGTPKLALARAAVQYLHCTHRTPDGEPCGQCRPCRLHLSGNHTDTFYSFPYLKRDDESICDDYMPEWQQFLHDCPMVEDYRHWLELLKNDNAQPQIFVKESAAIVRKMNLSSFTSRYKVLVMWLPEKMRDDCANKLLKLIEEPYDDCKFILVSDNAQAVLPTIFSRTQRVELLPPSTPELARHLADSYHISRQQALAIASVADGNANTAIQLLQDGNETHEFFKEFVELMRMAYSRNMPKLKMWSERVAEMKREKSRRFLDYCARLVRENFIYRLKMPELNYLTDEEAQFSTRFSPFINEKNVEQLHLEFTRAATDIAGNGNAKIVLFDLALRTALLIKLKT